MLLVGQGSDAPAGGGLNCGNPERIGYIFHC